MRFKLKRISGGIVRHCSTNEEADEMNRSMIRIGQNLFLALAFAFFVSASMRADDAAGTFKAKCAGCHGPDGKGNTPAGKAVGVHDFASSEVQKMSDADLTGIISMGKNKMPAYTKTLKDTEITALVAYVRSLGK
jgi:mono/diheme cytochrome c family protein